jgi:hypothetical protein
MRELLTITFTCKPYLPQIETEAKAVLSLPPSLLALEPISVLPLRLNRFPLVLKSKVP